MFPSRPKQQRRVEKHGCGAPALLHAPGSPNPALTPSDPPGGGACREPIIFQGRALNPSAGPKSSLPSTSPNALPDVCVGRGRASSRIPPETRGVASTLPRREGRGRLGPGAGARAASDSRTGCGGTAGARPPAGQKR